VGMNMEGERDGQLWNSDLFCIRRGHDRVTSVSGFVRGIGGWRRGLLGGFEVTRDCSHGEVVQAQNGANRSPFSKWPALATSVSWTMAGSSPYRRAVDPDRSAPLHPAS
jgi:hypothetical protein